MANLLYITDIHLRSSTPRCRKDTDYLGNLLAQLEFVFNLAEELKVDAIICGGDVGDTPLWTIETVNRFVQLRSKYKTTLITTLGQHDVLGKNMEDYKNKTHVGMLECLGLLHVLISGQTLMLGDAYLSGWGFGEVETKELLNGARVLERVPGTINLALIHASVGNDDSMGYQSSIHNQVLNGVDIALFGDIHAGIARVRLPSGCVAVSPGSLCRQSIKDKDRKLYCLHIVGKDIEFIEIPTTKYEVFEEAKETTKRKVSADDFVEILKNAGTALSLEPKELVKVTAEKNGYSLVIANTVIERIPIE